MTTAHLPSTERTGSSDYGHVRGSCACGWASRVWHSRRTTEGYRLAERDAIEHAAARDAATDPIAAIEAAEAAALAAHNAGTCGESEWSCSWCQS